MDEQVKRLATERRELLENWLRSYKQASQVVAHVDEAYQVAKWEEDVLLSAPKAADGLPWGQLEELYTGDLNDARAVFPPMPSYDPSQTASISVAGTVSASATYGLVAQVSRLPDERARQWSVDRAARYQSLQAAAGRRDRVRSLLGKLAPRLVVQFDEAERSYRGATDAGQSQEAAAFAMRNVLEHYRGELFARARRWPKENMTWPGMAERLGYQRTGPKPHSLLLREEVVWGQLEKDLSNLGKAQVYSGSLDLVTVHTQFLDHLFTVLTLVKL